MLQLLARYYRSSVPKVEDPPLQFLCGCLKIRWGPVFEEKAAGQGATNEHPRSGL